MIPCAPFQTFERIAKRNIDVFVRMIGPMTIACLMVNTVTAACWAAGIETAMPA